MKYLPIGLNVQNMRCVVVGGGEVGARKVRNLLEAGAEVHLVAPGATSSLVAMAEDGRISWHRESFRPEHIHGALLAVAATDDEEVNAGLVGAATELGILVCDASSAERSRYIFGALHRGDGVTVAVFSDGRDPGRSRTTRDRISSFLAGGGGSASRPPE